MWKKNLNINVNIINQEWKVYLDTRKLLKHEIARAGWIGDYNDPNAFLELMASDNGNNHTGFKNKKYDNLLKQAGRETNALKRLEIFQKLEDILHEEVPVISIYTYVSKHLIRPELKGWYSTILDWQHYKYLYLEK